MNRSFLFSLLGLLPLLSCQDVVDLEVPESEPQLVVDGWVTDQQPARVSLSTTDAYFAEEQTPRVSNAQVYLLENGDTVAQLRENKDTAGLYRASFTGQPGQRYRLLLTIPNGPPGVAGTWQSAPEILRPVPTLDSINIRRLDRNTQPPALEAGAYALGYFQERPGPGDYLNVTRSLNDSIFQRDIFALEDEGVDGFYFGSGLVPPLGLYGPFDTPPHHADPDTFRTRLESITQSYYDFLQVLSEQINVGTPFDAAPALILGNIRSTRDSSQYAFGYFRASATSSAQVIFRP